MPIARKVQNKSSKKNINLFEALFERRDREREMLAKSIKVVDGDNLPVENNRMGIYRWYLHPDKEDVAVRTMLFWAEEIPPGSKSGKQKHQGGRVHYVQEGQGYTDIDGVRYDWEKGDMILLPIRPQGGTFQHFNSDGQHKVRLVCAEPNWFDALGVDLGSGFEQLENSPDYKR